MAFAFGAWALCVGWSHGILDVHAWRQSHTAISVHEMLRGGSFWHYRAPWHYRTPIFGPALAPRCPEPPDGGILMLFLTISRGAAGIGQRERGVVMGTR